MTSKAEAGGPAWLKWLKGGLTRLRQSFFMEFTLTFAAVALVVSLLAGLVVSSFLGKEIRDESVGDVSSFVEEVTAPRVVENLAPEQMAAPLTGEELAALDRFVRGDILNSRTVRVNVYNPSGTVVYSSHQPLLGQTFPLAEPLQGAIQGETSTEIEEPGRGEHAGLEGYSQVLEVYTPIRFEGSPEVAGVFEIYRDYGPIAAIISDIQRNVYLGIGAALAFVYLVLLLVVKRGSDLIRRQQEDIKANSLELKSSYESIVAVLCAALDLRDHVTHGHAQRVSELASVVAWQMGLRKDQLRLIEQAAILHDIGKIGVADSVLSKPGGLTEQEWEEMRKHPELGYQILKEIEFLKDAAEIVYAHHERFDGNGYPRGLRGEDIPVGARVFAVVDAYDAMTSHRPYRRAMPHNQAVEEISRHSGTQFDPQVVRAFKEAERRGLVQGASAAAEDVETFFARVTHQGRRPSPAKDEPRPTSPSETV
ncbi:MAG: HD-GYP domain-containing protein [Dehalococcoidia bacterium]